MRSSAVDHDVGAVHNRMLSLIVEVLLFAIYRFRLFSAVIDRQFNKLSAISQ